MTTATMSSTAAGVGATGAGWVARRADNGKGQGREEGRVELAATPVRLRWAFDGLVTADGHELSVTFATAVAAVDEPAERAMLAEAFLRDAAVLMPAGVVDRLGVPLRAAAAAVAGSGKAEAVLGDEAKPRWVEAMRRTADEAAFAAGLEVLPPYDLDVTSPTLQRERLEQMQRTAAERRSADRVGHFARAAELVKQWDALKASVPSLTPGRVLEQINPADRGAMLETLLMASGESEQRRAGTPCLWAVAGPSLVRVDAGSTPPKVEVLDVPTAVGPLRSVSHDAGRVLVGARNGVLVVDPHRPAEAEVYACPALVTEHGFTTPTLTGDLLRACHKDAGLVTWRRGETAEPTQMLSPNELGGDAKHLAYGRGGWSVFAVGSRVMKVDAAGRVTPTMTAAGTVVAVLNAGPALVVVADDGTVTQLDGATLDKLGEDRPGSGRVTGAALLPWLTTYRLLLLSPDGPVESVGLEDQLVTQYAGGPVGVRAAAASAGRVAGVSGDRQKVVVWDAWDGRKVAAEVHVAAVTRHRVADVAFG